MYINYNISLHSKQICTLRQREAQFSAYDMLVAHASVQTDISNSELSGMVTITELNPNDGE